MCDELFLNMQYGKELRLVAEYKSYMVDEVFRLGCCDTTPKVKRVPYECGKLEAYIDGELYSKSELNGTSSFYWKSHNLTDEQIKKIGEDAKSAGNLGVVLIGENVSKYDVWLDNVIENGKDEEVREYCRKKTEELRKNTIEYNRTYIKEAETYLEHHDMLMTEAEYEKWCKDYNDFQNEGGEGCVPNLPTLERYNRAKEELEKLEGKMEENC